MNHATTIARALLPAALALLAGCATITGSETQSVSVQAVNRDGAPVGGSECRLNNDKGAWNVKPPAFVTVNKSGQDMNVRCEAPGHEPGLATAISRANSGLAGNIIFGGGIGALIDHNKGTAYDYPNLLRVVFGMNRVIDKAHEGPADAASGPISAPVAGPAASPVAARSPAPGVTAPASGGGIYRYAWAERQYGGKRFEFQVRATGSGGAEVSEVLTIGTGEGRSAFVTASRRAFLARSAAGEVLVEFAPYLPGELPSAGMEAGPAEGYPGDGTSEWQTRIHEPVWDEVVTAAGTFKAVRYMVTGSRSGIRIMPPAVATGAKTFQYTAWYAPGVKRYVKARHQMWDWRTNPFGDEHIELVEYRQE